MDLTGRLSGRLAAGSLAANTAFAFVASLALLALAWQSPSPITLDVGGPDAAYLSDLYDVERNAERDYRWVPGGTILSLPGVGVRSWQVSLTTAAGSRPGGPVRLEVLAHGKSIFQVDRADPGFRTYTFTVPASDVPAGDLELRLDIPNYRPPGEERDLGLAIDRIEISSNVPRLPAPLAWLALAGALAAIYATLWLVSRRAALLGWCLAALLVGLLVFFQRLYITPVASYLLMITTLAFVGLYAARGLWLRLSAERQAAHNVSMERLALVLVLMVVLAYALIVFGGQVTFLSREKVPDDFSVFYNAGTRLHSGQPLYELNFMKQNPFNGVYKYPPLFALLMESLSLFPNRTALSIWQFVGLLLLGAALYAIIRSHERTLGGGSPTALLFVTVTLLYQPLVDTLKYGQMDIAMLALVAFAYAALRAGKPAWSGLPLAIAVLFKLYPAMLLVFLLLRREWRALASFAVSFIVLCTGSILLTGPSPWITYLTQVLPRSAQETAWVENLSFAGFLARLVSDRIELIEFSRIGGPWVPIVTLSSYLWAILVLVICVLVARKPASRGSEAYALAFAAFTCASVLVLPAAWYHYMTLMLLPIGITFFVLEDRGAAWWVERGNRLAGLVVALVASVALLTYASFWLVWNGVNLGGPWKLALSFKFYGLLGLWVACLVMLAWCARRDRVARPQSGQVEEAESVQSREERVPVG
jgi:alpha-1,2-mannosyltransferase